MPSATTRQSGVAYVVGKDAFEFTVHGVYISGDEAKLAARELALADGVRLTSEVDQRGRWAGFAEDGTIYSVVEARFYYPETDV